MQVGEARELKFVPHHLIGRHYCEGWWVVNWMAFTHHGDYSVVMERIVGPPR